VEEPCGWERDARAEIGRLCAEFRAGIRAVKRAIEREGGNADSVLATTALFDGPSPKTVRPAAFGESVRMFGSRGELLRAVPLSSGAVLAELGVWKGSFSRLLLDHFKPSTLHLFDLSFDLLDPAVRANPAVRLHEGDSGTAITALPDGSLDLAYVDGDHSYAGARRDLFGILPKVKPGGYIQINDYTPWSVLSGFPYGVMANVNELLNSGAGKVVGFAWHAFGHHDVLIRRS